MINRQHLKRLHRSQRGFTIVELMIATAVLSVILVVVTVVMIGLGNLYYKGAAQAKIQDNARDVTDEISKALELNTGKLQTASNGIVQAYCIGTTRYFYVVGVQQGTDAGQSQHVLWRDNNGPVCSVPSASFLKSNATPSPNGVELIAPNARLTAFDIIGSSPYTITIAVAYGDPSLSSAPQGAGVTCNNGPGDTYCATTSLTTIVAQRITP